MRGFNNLVKKLADEVGIDSVKLESETLYQIDPSPRQLVELIRKGYFNSTIKMKRIK